MGKTLILTEKPSVAKDFASALGVQGSKKGYIENERYVITWCVGHLVALAYPEKYNEKYKKWSLTDLPFLPESYLYEIIPAVKEQYTVVHKWMQSKEIDTMLYCGDSGREGEVIGRLIRLFGGIRYGIVEKRVWIDSYTKEEILRGIREAKPLSHYDNLADAGILRGIEDYAFGINFSRALTLLHGKTFSETLGLTDTKAISVGRVMTCVLGMVVEREKQIENFTETLFYKVIGNFDGVSAEWKRDKDSVYADYDKIYKDNGFLVKSDAEKLIEHFMASQQPAKITALEVKDTKKKAPLLYNLAELQNDCSKRFKISPEETLKAVQELYEKKLTTYPRTDARVLSSAVAKEIRTNIAGLAKLDFCNKYVTTVLEGTEYQNIGNTSYTNDSKITDHYAIIPTGNIENCGSLSDLQRRVYQLIVKRFLAIFYPPAVYTEVKISFALETEHFHVGGKELKAPGYLEVSGKEDEDEQEKPQNQLLSFARTHKIGDTMKNRMFSVCEGKTNPPKRYDTGSMVLAMENAGKLIEDAALREQMKGSGIGTSATRAEVLSKLVRIGYLLLNNKTQVLTPSAEGFAVFDIVNQTLPDFLSPEMTAQWETKLTQIAEGNLSRRVYEAEINAYIREKIGELKSGNVTLTASAGTRDAVATSSGKVGSCPCCGKAVQETPKAFSCSDQECGFALWKNDMFFTSKKKTITAAIAKSLLNKGEVKVTGLYSEKKGKKYDATVVMSLNGNKARFELKL